jgi:hypothetical protein
MRKTEGRKWDHRNNIPECWDIENTSHKEVIVKVRSVENSPPKRIECTSVVRIPSLAYIESPTVMLSERDSSHISLHVFLFGPFTVLYI